MSELKFKPIWEYKRYSLGYFKEGFKDIRMFLQLSSYSRFFWEGIYGVWTTFKAMILGRALKYKLEKWDD